MPVLALVAAPSVFGHVFQGRYRTELVEDETYLWTVTRYVHLSPVRGRLVEHPAAWAWSSYPGYAHPGRRLDWVAYDELLASWGGAFGGPDPAGAYRRYVTAALSEPPESPWKVKSSLRFSFSGQYRSHDADDDRAVFPSPRG